MATPVPVFVAAGLLLGGAAGVAAEQAGLSPLPESESDEVVEATGVVLGPAVSVLDCPDGAPVAVLAGGDGVLATGRTEDGLWIEIRSPLDVTSPAWMSAGTLDPDGDLDALPVHECGVEATTTTVPGATTTSSTTTTSTSTTTTEPGETTTVPPVTTPPPTQPTTPPPPPDTTPPTIGTPFTPVTFMVTLDGSGQASCTSDPPPATTALITVPVTDNRPQGLVVTMTYRTLAPNDAQISSGVLNNVRGPTNGNYRGTLGPLPQTAATGGANASAEITIRAVDAAGNQARPVVFIGPQIARCPG